MSQTILVTGATSGFGKAIAELFAQHQFRVIITGRRADRLQAFAKELTEKYIAEVYSIAFDVQKKSEVKKAIEGLPAEWKNIDMLVNNAGLAAGLDNFAEASLDDWDQMIDTNVKGLLYVTRQVLPLLLKSNNPYIFNIGSTASKYVYEKGGVYCATKFAVDALTQAMRIDLLKQNVRVTAIHPGAAETEFSVVRFKGDEEKAKQVYKGYQPLKAEDIASAVFYCATLPKHVCIGELVITPTAQVNPFYVNRNGN